LARCMIDAAKGLSNKLGTTVSISMRIGQR
jgi:hypothetical protein